jgi:predicted lipoprotein with Yx(FWY)xxD motif
MKILRRSLVLVSMALVVSVFLVACGGVQPTNTGNTSNNTMNSNNQQTGYGSGTTYASPTASATMSSPGMTPTASGMNNGNMGAFIHTAVVTLNGKMVHVLTTNKGYMLYYYTKDMMLSSSCTGGCAMNWPPLLAPQGMMTVDSSQMLPRKLSVHQTANGNQVFYDGHALYTYAGDMKPGQFNGRGIGNAWYLVGFTL